MGQCMKEKISTAYRVIRLPHSGDSDHKLIQLFSYPLLSEDHCDRHLVLDSCASHGLKAAQKAQDLQNLKIQINIVLKPNGLSS